MILGILIAWGFNLLFYWPFGLGNKELVSKTTKKVLYVLFIFFTFFGFIIYLIMQSPYKAFLFLFLLVIQFPILIGVIGILVKNMGYIIASFIGTLILMLLHGNGLEELPDLLLFAAVVLLYLEISDTMIKYSESTEELQPDRDENDYVLTSESIANYLLILTPMIGFTILSTYLIFYSQITLKSFLPPGIVNSLEFNSANFLIIVLILFAISIIFGKWLVSKKLFSVPSTKE